MAFTQYHGPDFSFASLRPEAGPLEQQLGAWAKQARAAGRVPVAYLTAVWCPPSAMLEESLGDPQMQRALGGVAAATFDVDTWGEALDRAGFSRGVVPVFFVIDAQGRPTGQKITGAAWGENTPANMAPPLEQFFAPLRTAIPAPVAGRSTGRSAAIMIGALALVAVVVWLKIRQAEQDQDAAQDERIRREVQRSIQDSLAKQKAGQ